RGFTFRNLFATIKPMLENENEILEDLSPRVYELGYLLVPSIAEEDIPVNYGNLKDLVLSFGGEIIADEVPKTIPLAYQMDKVVSNVRHKFNKAYFGWTKFVMDPQKVLELKKNFDLDSTFVRFLIIKTVKENTIAAKRFVRGTTYRRSSPVRKTVDSEPAVPINKEEIDKEIEALIAP
ncbi:MAG: 30S ribosomal protein S6, partial [Candidatus Paceibacterota bacterium]